MMYEELVKDLRYLAKVYSICENENTKEYNLAVKAADAIEELSHSKDMAFVEKDGRVAIKFVPKWIPVEERLPEHEYGESTSVLTVDLFGVMRVAYFDGGNWCCPSGEALTTMRVAPITHWMPLPEPPKGDE